MSSRARVGLTTCAAECKSHWDRLEVTLRCHSERSEESQVIFFRTIFSNGMKPEMFHSVQHDNISVKRVVAFLLRRRPIIFNREFVSCRLPIVRRESITFRGADWKSRAKPNPIKTQNFSRAA